MQALIVVSLVVAGAAVVWAVKPQPTGKAADMDTAISSQSKRTRGLFYPTAAQWATLTVEPCQQKTFRSEYVTEGKIAVDEDRSTPIFSPYAGRVTKLFVKPGDVVTQGQTLFTVEATDMVQAQNDFITASTALNKARSTLNLAQINDKRQRLLYEGKAVPLKEVQQAQGTLDAAENDVRSADVALEASRNRLRILGKTDQEITEFQTKGTINPATPIYAPIGGTIVQRKVGPGQYVGSGASDPVFVIGDLSTVWVVAYIRETEAPMVRIGQPIYFTVLAYPDRSVPGQDFLCGDRARSHHAPPAGAGVGRQRRRTAQAGNVRQREDPHRRRRNGDCGPARRHHPRGRARPGVGRARPRYRDRAAPDQGRAHQRQHGGSTGRSCSRRPRDHQGQPLHRPGGVGRDRQLIISGCVLLPYKMRKHLAFERFPFARELKQF